MLIYELFTWIFIMQCFKDFFSLLLPKGQFAQEHQWSSTHLILKCIFFFLHFSHSFMEKIKEQKYQNKEKNVLVLAKYK